jgi:hypothetical protein
MTSSDTVWNLFDIRRTLRRADPVAALRTVLFAEVTAPCPAPATFVLAVSMTSSVPMM